MKNSRIVNNYYVIYMPSHPKAMKSKNWNGYVYEHIVIAEKELGRGIREDEEVHHLDFNRLNNSPENLIVLPSISHVKLHTWMRYNKIKPIQKEVRRCKICNNVLRMTEQKNYCSHKCYLLDKKSKLDFIGIDQIKQDFKELKFAVQVAKKYNISDNGLRKWLRNRHNYTNESIRKLRNVLL